VIAILCCGDLLVWLFVLLWRFVVRADFLFCNLHRYVSLQLTLDVRNWILCLFCTLDSMLLLFWGCVQ
jgi:hypothetical protein